jgi:hypothetical protein
MCNASSISTGASVLGTYTQMQAAKSNAAYQASVANQNAAIAEAQAGSVGHQGTNEQVQIRQKAKQVTASQKTAFAANGLDTQSGSALDVLSDTALLSEQDVQTSRYNTAMQMWGLNNQANQYRAQAKNAIQTGKNQAWSSLLSGVSSAAQKYSSYGGG